MTITTLLRSLPAGLTAGFAMLSACAGYAQAPLPSSTDKKLDSPFAAFRLGAAVTPVASLDTGLDITFPRLRIGPAWTTRVDVDFTARFHSASFGSRRDAELALNVCQVYTAGGVNRGRFFLGGGLGPSVGPRNGLTGKVFAGTNFTTVLSLEAEAQFPTSAHVRAVLMLRLSAL